MRRSYLVKWSGYSNAYTSWEPVSRLNNAQEAIADYERKAQPVRALEDIDSMMRDVRATVKESRKAAKTATPATRKTQRRKARKSNTTALRINYICTPELCMSTSL